MFTPQDYKSMFGHFTTLCMKGLRKHLFEVNSSEELK